jgi:hypothetical protein
MQFLLFVMMVCNYHLYLLILAAVFKIKGNGTVDGSQLAYDVDILYKYAFKVIIICNIIFGKIFIQHLKKIATAST